MSGSICDIPCSMFRSLLHALAAQDLFLVPLVTKLERRNLATCWLLLFTRSSLKIAATWFHCVDLWGVSSRPEYDLPVSHMIHFTQRWTASGCHYTLLHLAIKAKATWTWSSDCHALLLSWQSGRNRGILIRTINGPTSGCHKVTPLGPMVASTGAVQSQHNSSFFYLIFCGVCSPGQINFKKKLLMTKVCSPESARVATYMLEWGEIVHMQEALHGGILLQTWKQLNGTFANLAFWSTIWIGSGIGFWLRGRSGFGHIATGPPIRAPISLHLRNPQFVFVYCPPLIWFLGSTSLQMMGPYCF